jgi:uncharacterized OsmC-like protein
MEPIRSALEAASAYLTEHPDEAAYIDSPATAVLEADLRVRVTGPDGEFVTTDMPRSVGGAASAPSAGWLLRAAEAACVTTLIAMRAAVRGVVLSGIEVVVDSRSDDRGILGVSADVPPGPLSTRVAINVAGEGVAPDELRAIAAWAVDHCPVIDAVRRAVPIVVEVTIG